MLVSVGSIWFAQGGEKLNWNPPATYTVRGRAQGHSYSVTFKQANFAVHDRHIFWHRISGQDMYYPAWRTGKKSRDFIGWDSFDRKTVESTSAAAFLLKHNTELVSLTVLVDGRKWPIPNSVCAGYLDPDLGPRGELASVSRDGKRLKVRMEGSDGGGGYGIIWVFRRDGKYSVRNMGEDQTFTPLR
jgi:hypothetical protein